MSPPGYTTAGEQKLSLHNHEQKTHDEYSGRMDHPLPTMRSTGRCQGQKGGLRLVIT